MSLALIVLLPFLGAALPALMIRAGRNACAATTFSVSFIAFAILLFHGPGIFRGEVFQARWEWLPQLGLNVNFFLDGLGFFFAALILGMGLLIIVYARAYLSKNDSMGRFYTCLLLFQGAMVGIVLSDNILLLLIFWELTSLSSFLLIGYWNHLPESRQGARMALTVTGAGGLSMIAGMLLLGGIVGSYDLSVILQHRDLIQSSPLYLPALVLILLGCFAKSAQFPFHFWLPHAMAAPTPVSAYLHSATMVKAGLFLMARMWPALAGTEEWFYIVATVGLVTMVMGAWIALFKDDLKGLLAFSTVSHLGLVTMLLGLGTPLAAMAAVFHILNHATFKAALFMNVGIVDHEAGTRDIRHLGGLLVVMPITGTLGLIAAASMAGIPPLNGFLSKELMLEEAAHTLWWGQDWVFPALATLGATFSVAYSFRYMSRVFLGKARSDYPRQLHDPSWGMWLPPALLTVLVVLIGLFPATLAGPLVEVVTRAVVGGALPDYHLALWHGVTPALVMSLVALVGGGVLIWSYKGLHKAWMRGPHPDAKGLFEAGLGGVVGLTRLGVHGLHNGSLQRYVLLMVVAALLVGYGAFFSSSHGPGSRVGLPVSPIAVVLWGLMMVATLATVLLHRQRLVALVSLGVVGLLIAVGFAYFSAPDLALTQISVEVVTLILILLALNFLPGDTPVESGKGRRMRDLIIAALAGVGVGSAAWTMITRDGESISGYYLEKSLSEGGGTNVVNVILVDFRGFDTFGEIIVLGIAAVIIFALLDGVLRGEVGRKLPGLLSGRKRSLDIHPMLLAVSARVMLPFILMVGVYMALRGHNLPGGGFVAGLVVAVALVLQHVASGFGWASQRVKLDYHALIGFGVLTAGVTGVAAWGLGYPFLTSTFTHVHLPLIGEFELASAMVFDLGVFLTVLGAVMLTLVSLSRLGILPEGSPVSAARDGISQEGH